MVLWAVRGSLVKSAEEENSRILLQNNTTSLEKAEEADRELLSFVTRQCSLSANVVYFQFNASTGLYSPVPNYDDRFLQDPGFVQRDGAIEPMRACWCAQVFFQRSLEFCPAEYDTCIVRGSTGPIHCFHTTGSDSFIRSFWPVFLFWFFGLTYALFCSEPGGSSRDFLRRVLCTCRGQEVDQSMLDRDLERLLEQQPERAAFLYRSAISRARRNRNNTQSHWWNRRMRRRYNGGDITNTNATSAEHVTENDNDLYELYLHARYATLSLKTRVFSESDEPHDNELPSGDADPSESTRTDAEESPRSNNERAHGWIPAQFRREQVTLDDMDDEMEQGVRCAICLSRLLPGEIVGDIPCHHVFHKDCLKDWLKRSNRCPLCQQEGVATLSPCTMADLDRIGEEREPQ